MSELSWYENLKEKMNIKYLTILIFLLGVGISYLFTPHLLSLVSPASEISYKITTLKNGVYRPEGFSYNVSLLNYDVFGKTILVDCYPQDSPMFSSEVYVGPKETKTETLHFSTGTIGAQSFSTVFSWTGPLNVDRILLGQEDTSFTVLGADYSIDIVKSILNIASRDTCSFKITNNGNIGADLLEIRVVNKDKLSLASEETVSIPSLDPGKSTTVSYIFSVPASAKEGQVNVEIELDATYGRYKESSVIELPLSLQTSPQIRDIENTNTQLVALLTLAGTATAIMLLFSKRHH